ncbi:MAG TPA: PQQ-binding-like beta-propeller repeat protein [Chitinophagaceae bacterium]|nr:PQQ-binding-like beta-propeller repeat protein [Chitinophagaceae bacterium]
MKHIQPAVVIILCILFSSCRRDPDRYKSWQSYGGSKENIHYSSLTQIDTSNVRDLQVAWQYHTMDGDTVNHSQIQCNPIIIDSTLYGTSPQAKLFAVDAATGKQKWVFNPVDSIGNKGMFFIMNNIRGITYWTDGDAKRILYTAGSNLYSIDATTGKADKNFGNDGKLDLHDGLDRDVKDLFVTATSPGIIYKDVIIMGTRVDEGPFAAPGHIRAFEVRTGKRKWIFHTIPHPGEIGYETWDNKEAYKHTGGANAWSGFSLDEGRGILFAATGSASFDFYGGKRTGNNLFANCVLALDAATGKYIWHFQTIHHDVWDRDLPTAPILVTIKKNNKKIDAVAQVSKTGFVFVFERETGKPIYPIEERQVPTETDLTGEKLSPTQPFPSLPKPFIRQVFTEKELNDLLPDTSLQDLRSKFSNYKTGNMFNAPSKQGTVFLPGLDGGAEWGGPAFDPSTGLLFVNANEMAWLITIVDIKNKPVINETYPDAGKRLYQSKCMSCHAPNREGGGNNPSLININRKLNEEQLSRLISTGRRMMPAFTLNSVEKKAIASFVLDIHSLKSKKFIAPVVAADTFTKVPYNIAGYNKFLSKEGLPAMRPPWGTLNAIDLNTGDLVWKNTLGDDEKFAGKGVQTGTENYGGAVVTAGGLLFIAATKDGKFRAFNKRTGKLLWQTDLPVAGFATPSIYEVNGKQFIVIACGGGKLKTKSADVYVAFTLPDK